jgi:uncharacterized protein YjaG (DUF416 family)
VIVRRFDEDRLKQDLERLPVRLRVAFAAACAERLRPAYLAYAARTSRGDPSMLEALLDRLWSDLEGQSMTDDELSAAVDASLALVPDEDEKPWVIERDYAEDAASALAFALMCRKTHDSQQVVWAARTVFDSLDEYVIERQKIDIKVREDLERLYPHPLIQAEAARQRRDLEELSAADIDAQKAIAEIRERAKRDALTVLSVA